MTDPNPFAAFMATQQQTPETVTTPAPVTVAPTTNPALVDPAAAQQAAQYAAWQAQQLAAQQAALAAAAVPVAPPAPPAAPALPPGVDPAMYAAFMAAQQAAQVAPVTVATPAPPAQFVQPPANPYGAPSGGTDPFDDPAPPRPRGPRLEEMSGRLLLVIPKGMDKGKGTDDKGNATEYDRMTADVIVLDGGPMAYGGKPTGRPPVPHDKVGQIPWREVGMYITGKAIISQARDAWAKRQRNEPGMVVGRLGYGEQPADPKFQAPWVLEKATPADKDIARAYLATIDPFA